MYTAMLHTVYSKIAQDAILHNATIVRNTVIERNTAFERNTVIERNTDNKHPAKPLTVVQLNKPSVVDTSLKTPTEPSPISGFTDPLLYEVNPRAGRSQLESDLAQLMQERDRLNTQIRMFRKDGSSDTPECVHIIQARAHINKIIKKIRYQLNKLDCKTY